MTHGLTPSNSYLFAWHNCCVERCATNRVDASIELFRSGEVVTTFNGVVGRVAPRPPEGYVGNGQDEAWVRANFPDEADHILAMGYENWLLNEYVGVNEENGHFQTAITVASLPDHPLVEISTVAPPAAAAKRAKQMVVMARFIRPVFIAITQKVIKCRNTWAKLTFTSVTSVSETVGAFHHGTHGSRIRDIPRAEGELRSRRYAGCTEGDWGRGDETHIQLMDCPYDMRSL